MSLLGILDTLKIDPKNIKPLHGGDTNKAYHVSLGVQSYFLKISDNTLYTDMLTREATGLITLKSHTHLKVPDVIQTGTVGQNEFLLLEWLADTNNTKLSSYSFGQGIAELHLKTQSHFGFQENNYIANLVQKNTQTDNWPDFYANCRILPLVKILSGKHLLSAADIVSAERFCSRIQMLFPEEAPALLHGDLWSGNYIFTGDGAAAIFDPSVYYGHREMDIAMTKLFGGFSSDFYIGYNDRYPLEKGWLNRLGYAQLYPLLVHAILFEGHYVNSVKSILRAF